MLEPHQQRVVEEHDELFLRTTKLGLFFATDMFKSLDLAEQCRLSKQWHIMGDYVEILAQRIAAFSAE